MNNSIATTAQLGELNAAIQEVYTYINSKLQGKLFTFGATTPSASDQTLPWIRTDSSNNFLGVYTFNTTAQLWVSQHLTPSTSNERRGWTGTESQLWSYDGGDGTDPSVSVPTDTTGAMWEVDHTADFKFLIGPGVGPGTGTTIAVGQTGGEERHTLTPAEGAQDPNHQHLTGRFRLDSGSQGDDALFLEAPPAAAVDGMGRRISGDSSFGEFLLSTYAGQYMSTAGIISPITPAEHNNMPPYLGMFVIKRTARKYYTVA